MASSSIRISSRISATASSSICHLIGGCTVCRTRTALTSVMAWRSLIVPRVLRGLHRYLYIVTAGIGLPIVNIAAFVMATQVATGLVVIKKWGKGMVTLRLNHGARVLIGDLHRASALGTLWFS